MNATAASHHLYPLSRHNGRQITTQSFAKHSAITAQSGQRAIGSSGLPSSRQYLQDVTRRSQLDVSRHCFVGRGYPQTGGLLRCDATGCESPLRTFPDRPNVPISGHEMSTSRGFLDSIGQVRARIAVHCPACGWLSLTLLSGVAMPPGLPV